MYSFYDEAVLRLGLDPEQTTLPKLTVFFNAGITIEGHKGVLDYKDNSVVVRIGKDKVKISGEKLTIREISRDELFVRGKIDNVGVVYE